mmetsp:Transcript_26194/g.61086  ORF Transcript_26194/g.61086 Transcript_26194/m.61086 type:complete len:84 (-) Transcript_26194:30-281(-)
MAIMHHVKAKGEDIECIKIFAKNVCDHFLEAYSDTDLWQDSEEMEELGAEILASKPPWSPPPPVSEDGSLEAEGGPAFFSTGC